MREPDTIPIKIENTNLDMTLNQISEELEDGETLILDVSSDSQEETDIIYDKLVTRGYDVKKAFHNENNQFFVINKNPNLTY